MLEATKPVNLESLYQGYQFHSSRTRSFQMYGLKTKRGRVCDLIEGEERDEVIKEVCYRTFEHDEVST